MCAQKQITLPVTTRGIGFGCVNVFRRLFHSGFKNIPEPGDIYQLYRLGLAAFEYKVFIAQHGTNCHNHDDFAFCQYRGEHFMTLLVQRLPYQVMDIIDAVGQVKVNGTLYIPRIAKNMRDHYQDLQPMSEQVHLSNLREVVLALADTNTPQAVRKTFYENNPIPGAIWTGAPDNPTLLNADEIMPNNYGDKELHHDIHALYEKMAYLRRRMPGYFKEHSYSLDASGSKAMLACNKQSQMTITPRNNGEELISYYKRIRVMGNIKQYTNIVRIPVSRQASASYSLLGEMPVSSEHWYPIYVMRDERTCCECSGIFSYSDACASVDPSHSMY